MSAQIDRIVQRLLRSSLTRDLSYGEFLEAVIDELGIRTKTDATGASGALRQDVVRAVGRAIATELAPRDAMIAAGFGYQAARQRRDQEEQRRVQPIH